MHLAVRALRHGEIDLGLAAGVRLMLSPESTLRLSALRALSPTARCHTFDGAADGYARGEGCGVLVLKRLRDAIRDGDRVLAEVAGTAVNHDGPSSGLTVPSGAAQARLLRDALADAGLQPSDVDAVEAHGTGTSLGDPIEVEAIRAVFSERPVDHPLVIGSVKTNLGHLELAAGAAGAIKAVLALQHELIPAQLHFREANPALRLDFPVQIASAVVPFPADHRRVIGVSAFGLSGTNAHVLLADPEGTPLLARAEDRSAELVVLHAATAAGLDQARSELVQALIDGDLPVADVAWTLARGRSKLPHRFAAVVADRDALVAALRDG
jgi:acyl transferase domain-containing protein